MIQDPPVHFSQPYSVPFLFFLVFFDERFGFLSSYGDIQMLDVPGAQKDDRQAVPENCQATADVWTSNVIRARWRQRTVGLELVVRIGVGQHHENKEGELGTGHLKGQKLY